MSFFDAVAALNMFRSADVSRRKAGVERAARIPQRWVWKAIVGALGDGKSEVKLAAITAFSESKLDHAFPLLLGALKHKLPYVRLGAANALGIRASKIEDERSAAYESIEKAFQGEGNEHGVMAMAMSMRNTGDPRAVDSLIGGLNHRYVHQQVASATVLLMMKDPKIFDALARALEKTNVLNVIDAATKGLAAHNDIRAIDFILNKLRKQERVYTLKEGQTYYYKDTLSVLMPMAVDALTAIKHPQKVQRLIAGLDSSDQPTRVICAIILGVSADPTAVPALMKVNAGKDDALRGAVNSALEKLQGAPQ